MSRSVTGLGAVLWLILCASLALVWGSGASRYATGGDSVDSKPMFYAGLVLFAIAAVGALIIKATGQKREESSLGGTLFLAGTALVAMVVGIVLDIMN